MLNDAYLTWGGDLQINPNGDVLLAANSTLGQQRVLRRLLTNLNDYIWAPDYGAGLGEYVGATTNTRQIVGSIRLQLFEEATVARLPQPAVEVDLLGNGGVYVDLQYSDAASLTSQSLTFVVSS
jgi:hypothetical protein